mmetsp:Transcript_88393/g.175752  ORF Transcript_88393/g.175752 Transcript_88393/m.175752 type:complete len:246 (+) Transcript_88393:67-804(+)
MAPVTPVSPTERGVQPSETSDALVAIKNTFISVAIGRPPSLDGFFEERMTSSCPVTRCPSLDRIVEEGASEDIEISEGADIGLDDHIVEEGASEDIEIRESADVGLRSDGSTQVGSKVLLLGDVLGGLPELGSPELPTVGSAGHHSGSCKPCAFAHTKGCENGANCAFCHLCGPGEKKRRQKQRVAQQVVTYRRDARPSLSSPLMCQPMMLPTAASPQSAVLPLPGGYQSTSMGGLHMAAVFKVF